MRLLLAFGSAWGVCAASCTFVSPGTLALLKATEGFVALPAPDQVGAPTVGHGHQCQRPGCDEIAAWLPLTPLSAHELLLLDIKPFAQALSAAIPPTVPLNDSQWGALVSWAYSVGTESARTSALVRRLARGDDPQAVVAEELPKWNRVGESQVIPGLVARRAAEVALFNQPSARAAHPRCWAGEHPVATATSKV
ncbi:hypothetical protein H4R18_000236 [Coemansia javaensis]|uniref:Lysozyme n=1 Tax=Coemansia javaensis TaxID=2761396 RepID=A0A9W8HP40_9FUNG|nr:hypothetical protein H4R18_000236 [Coemansia javaensis]